MIIRRLRLQGFRSHADTDLTLPAGAVAIVGHVAETGLSNGSGKSSLMHAIEAALFGTSGDRDGRVKFSEQVSRDAAFGVVEVTVEHRDEMYRVRRSYSKAGRGKPGLDFERLEDHVQVVPGRGDREDDEAPATAWMPLTLGSIDETQALIEATLGISKQTWRASVYLAQNDPASFPSAPRRERRELLSRALGLDWWESRHTDVRRDMRLAEQAIATADGAILTLADGLDQIPVIAETVAALESTLPGKIAAVEQAAAASVALAREAERLEAARADRARAEAALRELEIASASLQEKVTTAAAAGDSIAVLEAEIERIAQDETALVGAREQLAGAEDQARLVASAQAEITALRRKAQDAVEAQAAVTREIEDLVLARGRLVAQVEAIATRETTTCHTCGQEISGEAAEKAGAELLRSAAEVDERIAAATTRRELLAATEKKVNERADQIELPAPPSAETLVALRARVVELESAPAQKAVAEERLRAARAVLEAAPSADALEEHRALVVFTRDALAQIPVVSDDDVAAARRQRADAEETSRARERDLATAQAQLEHETRRLAELGVRRGRHAEAVASRDRLAADLEVLRHLERAFGQTGVPAWIVETQAIPTIEVFANENLQRLGGAVTRVELRTEAEKKDGGVKDTLDIVCHTEAGVREFGSFSGGEQTRADIALRLGVAKLLAARSNADLRVLMLDEPSGLDAAGMDALAGVVRDLTGSGAFETILVASHQPELRDAFDASIQVTKTAGVSSASVVN